jgi:hypothetical protein
MAMALYSTTRKMIQHRVCLFWVPTSNYHYHYHYHHHRPPLISFLISDICAHNLQLHTAHEHQPTIQIAGYRVTMIKGLKGAKQGDLSASAGCSMGQHHNLFRTIIRCKSTVLCAIVGDIAI